MMDGLIVRPISSKQDTIAFIRFLWKIYRNYPAWVPPLMMDRKKLMDRAKNPFYKHADAEFFLAEHEGEVVGRIAAIINHNHNKEHSENIGFFGFFECINDQTVANALFDSVKKYLQEHGVKAMRGPVNPSVNDEIGLLIEGFDLSPTVMMTYNPSYYIDLIEKYGFKKAKDLYSYFLDQKKVYTERFNRAHELVKQRQKLTFRTFDMKHFHDEVDKVKDVYNKAWAKNWGAVQMTDEEFDALAADLKPVIVPELVIFAEKEGKTIGFALSLPDINVALKYNKNGYILTGLFHLFTKKKKIDLVRIIVLGVIPEYLNTGAGAALFYETAINAKKLGYGYGEASWILEDNERMVKSAEAMLGKITKRYRIYEMSL
jgi:GNAT superfamily N-acetyltransferase